MFNFVIFYNEGPIAIRYPRGKSFSSRLCSKDNIVQAEPRTKIELGKGEILKEGKDVTLVSLGYMSGVSLEAAILLSEEGIDCEVINARFIKPLDIELIVKSVIKTGKLVTVEEGVVCGGFGSFVLESIVDKVSKEAIIRTIGIPDRFIEHGDRQVLLDRCGLSLQKIKEVVLQCRR